MTGGPAVLMALLQFLAAALGWTWLFRLRLGAWAAATLGFVLGRAIPESWALDFAVPITFLAMIGPMLRTPAHVAAALVAIVASLAFASLPSGLGLFVAAPLAMLTGAGVEVLTERRRARETA